MNTVCKEQKIEIEGYEFPIKELDGLDQDKFWLLKPKNNLMQQVCTEHEWITHTMTITGGNSATSTVCRLCGISKPTTDFHIKENLKVISDNEWEDIWNEFTKSEQYKKAYDRHILIVYRGWLKKNYLVPEKKNV